MLSVEKRKLTSIGKIKFFKNSIEKLTTNSELTNVEVNYLLSTAILFLEQYNNNKNFKSYLDFAYYIILKYSLRTNNYKPLYDLSVSSGFYPITNYILNKNLLEEQNIDNLIVGSGIERFRHEDDYIETLEQHLRSNDFLKDQTLEKSYLAPTSFGKSSLIVSTIREFDNEDLKIVIVVPTKSLLMQTFKLIRDAELGKKIIVHDEMYNNENSFIAIFTQERALRLINRKQITYDVLFIDEAHNIFKGNDRSVLLTRLISRNRINNDNQKVIYLSPLVDSSNNLKIDSNQKINSHVIKFNIKEPEIFELKLNGRVVKYNRFVNQFYELGTETDMFNYILKNSKNKNFIYNYRPVKVELFAKEFNNSLTEIENSAEINKVISILKREVHHDFYVVNYLKFGLVYIHGKLPDLIKEYLEFKFKTLDDIKYIVANSVILEGMNLPIDNLFILNTRGLQGKELVNLIGRVNRLNLIFSNPENNLKKLEPSIHFVNSETYNRRKSNMENKIKLLRNRSFADKIENPTLTEFEIENLDAEKKQKAEKIQSNERLLLFDDDNEENRIDKYLIETGIVDYYYDETILKNAITSNLRELSIDSVINNFSWDNSNMLQKIDKFFIDSNLENVKDLEIKRLNFEAAQNYYDNYILINRKKSLNENILSQVSFFKQKAQSEETKLYFGTSYGEVDIKYGGNNLSFIDLKTKSESELVNLAIVKLKMEDDFVSFKLNKFIVMLYDFQLISKNDYNLYIYGTIDENKIALSKYGFNINLINKLDEDEQLDNLYFDEFNNLKGTAPFYEYLNNLNDLLQFEISRFIN